MHGWSCDGSYTVEAAFIFPLYIMLLVIFLMIGFYLYDKAVLANLSVYYVKRAGHMIDEPVNADGEMEPWRLEEQGILRLKGYEESFSGKEIATAFQKTASERLFLAEIGAVDCSVEKGTVTLSYQAEFRAPLFSELLSSVGTETGIFGESSVSRSMSSEEFVRIVRGILWRSKREIKQNGNPSEGQTLNQDVQ